MLPLCSEILAEAISMIVLELFLLELIVSRKAGCWTVVCIRLLTFPSAAVFINIYNVLMLFERSSREEVATVQLPCASDINI